ncbi:MAG TPA: FHA domain-containing protein, partial [Pirellulales bacterium]|nr:FHA domain-containing protein [Pirellulales bacterium]
MVNAKGGADERSIVIPISSFVIPSSFVIGHSSFLIEDRNPNSLSPTMFQPWRLKLREATEAFQGGRLDEAGRLLCQSGLREFRPAKQLLAKVVDRRLNEAEQCLAAGNPAAALARLDDLDRRFADTTDVRLVREAAWRMETAQRFARRGDFSRAEQEWARAAALLPRLTSLEDAVRACKVKGAKARELATSLHTAIAARQWPDVLRDAEALLELCPDHEAAREARRQAWSEVGINLRASVPVAAHCGAGVLSAMANVQTWNNAKQAEHLHHNGRLKRLRYEKALPMDESTNTFSKPPARQEPPAAFPWRPIDRFLLWVDGVGGYLVCTRDEVTLGQPVPEAQVDVPILGDLSRRHAKIRRDGEAYLIEPRRPVRLDGRSIDRSTALADGVVIELGNVRLRFRRPHPLSGTARLEFVTPHRTQPAADAVLLMAESCILGPNAQSHVTCGDWSRDLILYRQADELYCRRSGRFQVDGQAATDSGALTLKSQISG